MKLIWYGVTFQAVSVSSLAIGVGGEGVSGIDPLSSKFEWDNSAHFSGKPVWKNYDEWIAARFVACSTVFYILCCVYTVHIQN